MDGVEKNIQLAKETKVLEGLVKLSKASSQEIQRLQALKLAWSSKQRADAIRVHWGKDYDVECGALLEFSHMSIPFTPRPSKKKTRRAVYITIQCGASLIESELFVITNDSIEVRFPDKLKLDNVAPNFVVFVQVWGLNLPVKEKMKHLRYDAGFESWGQCQLRQDDTTDGKLKQRRLRLTTRAPPTLTGHIELKVMGAVPCFCEVIHEGFLNLWTETNGPEWRMLWVQLKNGKLRGSRDPAGRGAHVFQIELSSDLKIQESTRRRPNSFQLRDFNGRTILAAGSKDDMGEWMRTIRRHKEHLKRWGRFGGDGSVGDDDDDGVNTGNPWERLFEGSSTEIKVLSKNKKRRSRSVDNLKTPQKHVPVRVERIRRNSGETPPKAKASSKPDWMTSANRALPLISPVARYDPPTICLDKDESLAEDDLNNGPGMDETINDVLDKLDRVDLREERKPRRDTNIFHREILENTKKQALRKHHSPASGAKPVPLRTSTQMGDEGGIRKKFQPQVPTIEMYSPPQYVRSKVKICSPKQTYVQSHAIQSHQSILGEASPRTPNAKTFHLNRNQYVENIVSDIMADRYEEDDEDENWPPNQLTQHKRKKSVLPKFDHLETY